MQPLDGDDADHLRNLAHELSEALTAINGYLHGSQRHEGPKLREAINKTIEQTGRAGQILRRLRSILGTAVAYTVTHQDSTFYVRRGNAKGRILATFSNRQAAERFLEKQMASDAARMVLD